jgi:hypothetical protein
MVRFVATLGLVVFLVGVARSGVKAEGFDRADAAQTGQTAGAQGPVTVPSGTEVPLVVIRPVRAKNAKPQDALYMQTSYPVAIGGTMAIPAGTYVQGQIVSLTQPTRKVSRSTMRVRFTKLVFANGYTVALAGGAADADTMDVTVNVSTANDLLLDNGAQMALTLTSPLTLSATKVRAAIPLSKAVKPGSLASGTVCRPTPGTPDTPGTPGTPDTVIPGTPDTVIPGPDGSSTVIPGTPSTVIPGTPGTPGFPGSPGTVCPARPRVISSVPVAVAVVATGQSGVVNQVQ